MRHVRCSVPVWHARRQGAGRRRQARGAQRRLGRGPEAHNEDQAADAVATPGRHATVAQGSAVAGRPCRPRQLRRPRGRQMPHPSCVPLAASWRSGDHPLVVLLAARGLGLVPAAQAQHVHVGAQAQQARHEAAQLGGVAVGEEERAAQHVVRVRGCGAGRGGAVLRGAAGAAPLGHVRATVSLHSEAVVPAGAGSGRHRPCPSSRDEAQRSGRRAGWDTTAVLRRAAATAHPRRTGGNAGRSCRATGDTGRTAERGKQRTSRLQHLLRKVGGHSAHFVHAVPRHRKARLRRPRKAQPVRHGLAKGGGRHGGAQRRGGLLQHTESAYLQRRGGVAGLCVCVRACRHVCAVWCDVVWLGWGQWSHGCPLRKRARIGAWQQWQCRQRGRFGQKPGRAFERAGRQRVRGGSPGAARRAPAGGGGTSAHSRNTPCASRARCNRPLPAGRAARSGRPARPWQRWQRPRRPRAWWKPTAPPPAARPGAGLRASSARPAARRARRAARTSASARPRACPTARPRPGGRCRLQGRARVDRPITTRASMGQTGSRASRVTAPAVQRPQQSCRGGGAGALGVPEPSQLAPEAGLRSSTLGRACDGGLRLRSSGGGAHSAPARRRRGRRARASRWRGPTPPGSRAPRSCRCPPSRPGKGAAAPCPAPG